MTEASRTQETLHEAKARRAITIAAQNALAAVICDDGSLWRLAFENVDGPPTWTRLPPIPQDGTPHETL